MSWFCLFVCFSTCRRLRKSLTITHWSFQYHCTFHIYCQTIFPAYIQDHKVWLVSMFALPVRSVAVGVDSGCQSPPSHCRNPRVQIRGQHAWQWGEHTHTHTYWISFITTEHCDGVCVCMHVWVRVCVFNKNCINISKYWANTVVRTE